MAVLLPILAGAGWWYFRESPLPDYGPAYREYAYVTNGKSNTVTVIDAANMSCEPEADAAVSTKVGAVCAVMTADCLPVLLCNESGTVVSAVHAGWRGLLDGVIEASVKAMQQQSHQLMAWLGPAIGPQAFEVGDEVRNAFVAHDAEATRAFLPSAWR